MIKSKKCKCIKECCAYGRDSLNFFNCKKCSYKIKKIKKGNCINETQIAELNEEDRLNYFGVEQGGIN